MPNNTHDIPFIQDIMKLRLHMKANDDFADKIKSAILDVCNSASLDISKDAVYSLTLVHPEEVASTNMVPDLPVGGQCDVGNE